MHCARDIYIRKRIRWPAPERSGRSNGIHPPSEARFHSGELSPGYPRRTGQGRFRALSIFPKETGWLGWRQYFKNHSVVVDMFTNNNSATNEKIPGPYLSSIYCDYQKIWEILEENNINFHKENVLIGKLVPAGTGMNRYSNVELEENYPTSLVDQTIEM